MSRRSWLLVALVSVGVLPTMTEAGPNLVASPSDPRNFTWMVEGVLAVGGGGLTDSQVEWLDKEGFRAIASFRAEHTDPQRAMEERGIEHLYMPVEHAVDLNLTQLREFVAWAHAQEAAGRPMYIHCTNGWHRAAAFATAWEMKRRGLGFDEVGDMVEDRRPGTVMRAPAALLAYESFLTGKPGLTVVLTSPTSRPPPGGTMPAAVEVLAAGKPVRDAKVTVWSEESGLRFHGVTDPDGFFRFTYKAPVRDSSVDHLYARASLPGFLDGADNVELFYEVPVRPGQLDVDTAWTPQGIVVDVRKHGGHVHSHVIATGPDGWSFTEMASRGEVLVPLPPTAGPVTIRAERWGAEGAQATVDSAGAPPPAQAPPATRPTQTPPTGTPPVGPPASRPAVPPPRGVLIAAQDPPGPDPTFYPPPPAPAQVQHGAKVDTGMDTPQDTTWTAVAMGVVLMAGGAFLAVQRRDALRRAGWAAGPSPERRRPRRVRPEG